MNLKCRRLFEWSRSNGENNRQTRMATHRRYRVHWWRRWALHHWSSQGNHQVQRIPSGPRRDRSPPPQPPEHLRRRRRLVSSLTILYKTRIHDLLVTLLNTPVASTWFRTTDRPKQEWVEPAKKIPKISIP